MTSGIGISLRAGTLSSLMCCPTAATLIAVIKSETDGKKAVWTQSRTQIQNIGKTISHQYDFHVSRDKQGIKTKVERPRSVATQSLYVVERHPSLAFVLEVSIHDVTYGNHTYGKNDSTNKRWSIEVLLSHALRMHGSDG